MSRIQLIPYATIISFSILLCSILLPLNIVQQVDWFLSDQMVSSLNTDRQPSDRVKLILIDDISVNQLSPVLGRYPWPRGVYAPIIEFLNAGNAKHIYFDILFSEFEESTASHTEFVNMLKNHDNVHLVAILTHDHDEPITPPIYVSKSIAASLNVVDLNLPNYERLYFPIDDLAKNSRTIPISTIRPDSDGIYRSMPVVHKYNNYILSSLPFSLIQQSSKRISITSKSIHSNYPNIPISRSGEMNLNWYPKGIDRYSFSGILSSWQSIKNNKTPLIDPQVFKNSIVLIGSSAVGLHDLKPTPIHSHLPGVEIQATAISNILNGEVLYSGPYWISIILFLFIIFFTTYFLLKAPNLKRYLYLLLIPTTLISISCLLFDQFNIILKSALPFTGFWISYITTISYNSISEYMEKKKVKQNFSMYVSPKILNEISQNYKDIKPEIGKKKEVTILFTDIRSFTTLTETHPVETIIKILNDYFDSMIETIQENDGTVDKMIGDAIMAFWNAPINTDDHALKAVETALKMQDRLKELNKYWNLHALPSLEIGIGINTGECIVGNIGSTRRVNYTLIGDAVNATARLESLCKNYSNNILISDYTYEKVQHKLTCDFIDNVLVKGKSKPIKIYSPR